MFKLTSIFTGMKSMLKILAIMLLFVCSRSIAQPWSKVRSLPGFEYNGVLIDSIFRLPSDTIRNKTGLAQIGTGLFVGNGSFWTQLQVSGLFQPLENQRLSSTNLPSFTGLDLLPLTSLIVPGSGLRFEDSTGAGLTFLFSNGIRKNLTWKYVTGNATFSFQNKSYTLGDSADIAARFKYSDSTSLVLTQHNAANTYQPQSDSVSLNQFFERKIHVNILDWFAVGNGVTDNTTVLRNVAAYVSSLGGGEITIPLGTFNISDTIPIPANVTVRGLGNGGSIVCMTASNKSAFCVVGNNVAFDNLRITCSNTSVTAGAGIMCWSFQNSRIFNCQIWNFYINVDIVNGFQWTMSNDYLVGSAYVGLIVQNNAAGDAGDNCLENIFIFAPASNYTNAEAAIQLYSSGGVKMNNVKINDNANNTYAYKNGIEVLYNQATSILLLTNVSIENVKNNNIYCKPTASFGKILFGSGVHLDGNALASQDTGINIQNSYIGLTGIEGVIFNNLNVGVYNNGATSVMVGLNTWNSVTTKIAGPTSLMPPEFVGNVTIDGAVTASTLTANTWSSASGTMTISPSGTAAVNVSSTGIFPAANASFNSGTSANNWLISYSNQLLSNSSLIVGTVNSNSISMQVGGLQGMRVSASTADVNVGYNIGTVDMNAMLGVRGRYNSIGNAVIVQDSAGLNLFQVYNAGMVVVGTASSGTNPFQVNSGAASFAYGIYNNAPVSTISGSTSGSAIFCEKEMGSGGKEVDIYFANLNGTASFTFPVPFSYTPGFFPGSTLSSTNLSSVSTTSITVVGTGGTGVAILKGL